MMKRAIVFDLDGVLVDSKDMHYEALNLALAAVDSKYKISREEQDLIYEGLPTTDKLNILSNLKGLPRNKHRDIWTNKQEYSSKLLSKVEEDLDLVNIFKYIKSKNIGIGVASNSTKKTLENCLTALGVSRYVDIALSNEDIVDPKPSPEIYRKIMDLMGCSVNTTVVFEDSRVGRTAAIEAGVEVFCVDNRSDLTKEKIELALRILNKEIKPVNILIPMAGNGSRFAAAGYLEPKPLINVNGVPMIEAVVDSLNIDGNYIYVVQEEHYIKYNLETLLNRITPGCTILKINGTTEGAASTSLYAKKYIDMELPLIIANSDQIVFWNSKKFIDDMKTNQAAGSIAVFEASSPKWSYVKPGDGNRVNEVAEKKVISNLASVGIYAWLSGGDYVKYAEQMVDSGIKTNNEYYICPVYNEAILDGKKITYSPVGKMYGVGTPEDLEVYLDVANSA